MKIGFISGTGKEGQALAIRFGLSEHSIFIGSRDISKAELSGNQIRNILPDVEILCSDYKQTVLQSDIVFIALPFSVVENQLTPLKNELKGKYIVDTTVPLSLNKGKFTRLSGLKESVSQFLYNLLPPSFITSTLFATKISGNPLLSKSAVAVPTQDWLSASICLSVTVRKSLPTFLYN